MPFCSAPSRSAPVALYALAHMSSHSAPLRSAHLCCAPISIFHYLSRYSTLRFLPKCTLVSARMCHGQCMSTSVLWHELAFQDIHFPFGLSAYCLFWEQAFSVNWWQPGNNCNAKCNKNWRYNTTFWWLDYCDWVKCGSRSSNKTTTCESKPVARYKLWFDGVADQGVLTSHSLCRKCDNHT